MDTLGANLESETFVEAIKVKRQVEKYSTLISVMKLFSLYINSQFDYDAGFPLWPPFIQYPYVSLLFLKNTYRNNSSCLAFTFY